MINKKNIIILLVLMVIAISLFSIVKKEVWSGYFYPDANNLSTWVEANETFDSLESCRYWAERESEIYILENTQLDGIYEWDYECGLDCKYKSGFNVCKETLQ